MPERIEMHTDGTFNDRTIVGGGAAVSVRPTAGRQEDIPRYEIELRALFEAVKMPEDPCTVISDHEGVIGLATAGCTPRRCQSLWAELYSATAGKDVEFA